MMHLEQLSSNHNNNVSMKSIYLTADELRGLEMAKQVRESCKLPSKHFDPYGHLANLLTDDSYELNLGGSMQPATQTTVNAWMKSAYCYEICFRSEEEKGGLLNSQVSIVRYGELFGAAESSVSMCCGESQYLLHNYIFCCSIKYTQRTLQPESLLFVRGPQNEPVIRDMLTMRSIRIDPPISVSDCNKAIVLMNCDAGEYCWTPRENYCGSFPKRICTNLVVVPANWIRDHSALSSSRCHGMLISGLCFQFAPTRVVLKYVCT
eukprot:scaffold137233_cov50-Cyclotella_meneghiniana.AAC.2